MTTIDESRLEALVGTMVSELGAAAAGPLVLLGDKLGVFEVLWREGPLSVPELGGKLGLARRYLEEWASAMAASGYISVDESERFFLSPEQAAVFADPDSEVNLTGAYLSVMSVYDGVERLETVFKSGDGVGWGEQCSCLFCGTERFFKPGYEAHLVADWLPALDGIVPRLEAGGLVADVGCGHGASTLIMARAFPKTRFIGFDLHEPSIEKARAYAAEAGLENISFEVAAAQDFPGTGFDLVAFFDCLHDMGDPSGAARQARQALAPGGSLMIVEPMAGDSLVDNLNPVGRIYYAFSTQICVPNALSQSGGTALGAQAGEKRLRACLEAADYTDIKKVVETPFNMILEGKG